MDIGYKNKNLEKICTDEKAAQKNFGKKVAQKLLTRVSELIAAVNLHEISNLPPQRRHSLAGKLEGFFAVDLAERFRLIFYPCDKDGEIVYLSKPDDFIAIEAIVIWEVSNHYDD